MSRDERYVAWLSRHFFCPGWTHEDLAQEARLAMWLAPAGAERLAARRRLITIVHRELNHRPELWPERTDELAGGDVVELVVARERLRGIVEDSSLTEIERVAVGRALRGEPCSEKRLDNALHRAKRKLRSAA